jgi:CRISPR system Cascade subunit CasA
MQYSFNLIDKPWIPCIQKDGTFIEYGLQEVLARAHELEKIEGENPLVIASIYRLLLAILHRVYGPNGTDEWAKLREPRNWEMAPLDDYFHTWEHRFDLFDDTYPFYQKADDRVRHVSVVRLPHSMITNDTLFDHRTEETGDTFSPAKAARALLASQNFGFGGACHPQLRLYFKDSSCKSGVLFLVQGDTFFETLLLNLIDYQGVLSEYRIKDDRPAWEMDDPFSPDRDRPLGYLDYLTWQSRRIRLLPTEENGIPVVREMTITPGLGLDKDLITDAVFLDPMKHYVKKRDGGYRVYDFNENRALWRDSSAILQVTRSASEERNFHPPGVFTWLSWLVDEGFLDGSKMYAFSALGMASEKGKVNVFFYRQEHMPLPLSYFDEPDLVHLLQFGIERSEKARSQLWGATRRLATLLLSPDAEMDDGRQPDNKDINNLINHFGAERVYWSALEIPFLNLLTSLPDDPDTALTKWRLEVRQSAWDALEHAIKLSGESTRCLKAAVRAREQLARGLAKELPIKEGV